MIICNAGVTTLTIPNNSSANDGYKFIVTNQSGGTITIASTSSPTFIANRSILIFGADSVWNYQSLPSSNI